MTSILLLHSVFSLSPYSWDKSYSKTEWVTFINRQDIERRKEEDTTGYEVKHVRKVEGSQFMLIVVKLTTDPELKQEEEEAMHDIFEFIAI